MLADCSIDCEDFNLKYDGIKFKTCCNLASWSVYLIDSSYYQIHPDRKLFRAANSRFFFLSCWQNQNGFRKKYIFKILPVITPNSKFLHALLYRSPLRYSDFFSWRKVKKWSFQVIFSGFIDSFTSLHQSSIKLRASHVASDRVSLNFPETTITLSSVWSIVLQRVLFSPSRRPSNIRHHYKGERTPPQELPLSQILLWGWRKNPYAALLFHASEILSKVFSISIKALKAIKDFFYIADILHNFSLCV